MSAIPTGLVTYVFTDVEGSTGLWESFPEQMEPALARHDAIVKEAIADHDGHVFSHAGDGYGISFQSTRAGLDAVEQMQRQLAAEDWPEHATIRVRMGVHVGTAEERDGDYYGSAVNRAARLMSAGHGGQVLVSAIAQEETPDRPVLDLGVHRLKDLSAPEHIFQMVIDGLPSSFAPLRTLDETKTSLPVRPVNLVGRAADLMQLGDLTRAYSLVTICGPGGVGKTTLAIQAAANAAGRRRSCSSSSPTAANGTSRSPPSSSSIRPAARRPTRSRSPTPPSANLATVSGAPSSARGSHAAMSVPAPASSTWASVVGAASGRATWSDASPTRPT